MIVDGVVAEEEVFEVNKEEIEVETEKETKIAQEVHFPQPSNDSY